MSKGAKMAIGIAAAVVIPFAAPAIAGVVAGSLALSAAATTALSAGVGALMGAGAGYLTGGKQGALIGAITGGLGGYFNAGNAAAGLFGGAGSAGAAGSAGTAGGAANPALGLAAQTPASWAAGTTVTPAVASSATTGIGATLGTAVQNMATNPQALHSVASYLFNKDNIESLRPEQQALLEKIRQDSAQNAALTTERLAAARQLMNTGMDPTVAYANSMQALNIRKSEAQRTAALGGRAAQQPYIQRAYDIAAVERGAEAATAAAEDKRKALAAGSSALAGIKYDTSQPEQAALGMEAWNVQQKAKAAESAFKGIGAIGAARPAAAQMAQAPTRAGIDTTSYTGGYQPVSGPEDMFGSFAGE